MIMLAGRVKLLNYISVYLIFISRLLGGEWGVLSWLGLILIMIIPELGDQVMT